jgi:cytochrome c oxidase subunit II
MLYGNTGFRGLPHVRRSSRRLELVQADGNDGMKTASLGTALLLSFALLASTGASAQTGVLDLDNPTETEPLVEFPGDAPSTADPDVGEQPDTPELHQEVAPETEAVEEPVGPISPREDGVEPQVWGNLPELPFVGVPVQGGVNYLPAVSPVAHDTHWVSHFVHAIMFVIVIFVTFLVLYCIVFFNRKRNPNPAAFTHNTRLEVAWTLIPVLILIVIGSFSLPVLFRQLEIPEPDVTIKATGYQWFWGYEYVDYDFGFESFMLQRDELEPAGYLPEHYLMATDSAMVVPVGATIRMQMTGADVIHSWKITSFAVQMDAVPGRLNEMWFRAEQEGVYFGFCSELCGLDHTYMPITVKVVSQDVYDQWLDWAIDEFGGTRPEGEQVAALQR